MERVVTLETALELVRRLSPRDKIRLIEQVASDVERELMRAGPAPNGPSGALCADLGPAPSAVEIDQARQEEWSDFPREDL
jgi:hypothetical protein